LSHVATVFKATQVIVVLARVLVYLEESLIVVHEVVGHVLEQASTITTITLEYLTMVFSNLCALHGLNYFRMHQRKVLDWVESLR
jgi:hypothetical protein